MSWAKAAAVLRNAAIAASSKLESFDLDALPTTAIDQVRTLWNERAEWVEGFQNLIEGFSGLEQTQHNLNARLEALEARVTGLEAQRAVHRNQIPPPPPPPLEDALEEVCLVEDTPAASRPN